MGEQGSHPVSNHIVFVIMRNSRGKLFVYVALISVLAFIVFLLSRTHKSLKELEGVNEKCQQERDSLSAQLQVLYEHKIRLEKSLQQEKTDHRQSTEVNEKKLHENEIKLQQEKDKAQQLETQLAQLKASYSELEEDKKQSENALNEQMKSTQIQKNAEIEKLQTHISDLLAEKDKLELSNNAFSWKVEQHASENNLCHLQLQQANGEHHTCQQQLQKYIQNTVVNVPSHGSLSSLMARLSTKTDQKASEVVDKPLEIVDKSLGVVDKPLGIVDNPLGDAKKLEEHPTTASVNQTNVSPPKEKPNVLERPHIMSSNNNNANDGVLPKPMDLKHEESNKIADAALEVHDGPMRMESPNDKSIADAVPEVKNKEGNDLQQLASSDINKQMAAENARIRDQDSHPQVQPPSNFDNGLDHEDHGGERGEFGNEIPQYPAHDAKNQVEQPVFHHDFQSKLNKKKHFLPLPRQANNDIAAAQVQDMMNKSPGNVNEPKEHVLNPPPEFGAVLGNKINQFRNSPFLNARPDGHRAHEDKLYEEDDDDRENDDEPANGAGQGMRGNMFQDNDFEDQENQDNMDNAKEEEGVVVAPK